MNVTPWFPADAKPTRPGMYQIQYSLIKGTGWRWWDGERWMVAERDQAQAHQNAARKWLGMADLSWRGVLKRD